MNGGNMALAKYSTKIKGQGVRRASLSLLAIATLFSGFAIASPAQAVTPAFEIFYGPNCGAGKTASRVYTGVNAGEQWINDTFTSTQWGTPGSGQPIRYNAASMYVSYATVVINYDRNDAIGWRSTGVCVNFNDHYRNGNVSWSTSPY